MFSYSLNSLIVFFEVVKLNSFSKAADLLFMTQPGVSNHVAQLEAQTGSRLVKRENGSLKLTKEGRMVFKHAEKIEAVARGLENAIRTMKQDTPPILKVATTSVYSKVMVPFILGTFQEDNPDIGIALDVGNSADLMKSIVSMKNDVVIVANQKTSKSLAAFPLVKEELVAIVAHNHPFSARTFISLKDIEGHPLIIREKGSSTRNTVLAALELMKTKPSALIDMKSTEFIKEWVSQGKGISILIKRALMADDFQHLRMIPLTEKLSLDVSVLFLKSRKFDLSIRRFLHHVEELKAKQVL
jgi:LysR family transcriptional regulator, transcriptional activator of the cysJI operon